MSYQWDAGNIDHIALHKVTPAEAEQVIENDPMELQKTERNGEQRIVHLGETDAGRVLVVVTTLRDRTIRVVTAYPAKKLRKHYLDRKVTK